MKLRLRLSTLFLLINSLILLLPVAAIALLKLYDSLLIRQTENALITQAVMLSNVYKRALRAEYPELDLQNYGRALPQENWYKEDPVLGKWRPIPAVLDLRDQPLLPRAENPEQTRQEPDPTAWHIGQQLEDLLRETQLTTLAGMRILDMNGIIVATTGWLRGHSLSNRSDVARALEGNTERAMRHREEDTAGSFFSPISRSTRIRVYVTHPIVLDKRILGAIHLVRTPPNLYQSLYKQSDIFIYYGLLIVTITVMLSLFTSYAINRPIRALVRQARQVTSDRRSRLEPLENPIAIELEELSHSLATMADRQVQRAEQIENFASYVSHEFKTPITSINGAVEILQENLGEMPDEEKRQFLDNIAHSSQRMQLLMSQLTELAKADTTPIPREPVDLVKVLKQQAKHYQPRFRHLSISGAQDEHPVYMNRELLASILQNLFENVYHHGGDAIKIKLGRYSNQTKLIFSDNGPGISAANAKRIFEPFFTTARKRGGTGLGLAILSTLMSAHHGSIRLLPSERGCRFELTFPHLK
ncbi:ATP-binding protein [uncultured Microbulbifer sp.]|uniref:sensor histidine kinase n=1 Tax=uncultured Microbulbifer sp. TaxID=348147 RepID=UPI0025FEAC29|nr:ATP-binding protein [uncultured Microbulbifer sp.]